MARTIEHIDNLRNIPLGEVRKILLVKGETESLWLADTLVEGHTTILRDSTKTRGDILRAGRIIQRRGSCILDMTEGSEPLGIKPDTAEPIMTMIGLLPGEPYEIVVKEKLTDQNP